MAKKETIVPDVQTINANPHSDPVCAGCDKPINTVTVRDDFGVYHNQHCQADRENK